MPSTTIDKHTLKARLQEKLLDKCLDFQAAGGKITVHLNRKCFYTLWAGGSHHLVR